MNSQPARQAFLEKCHIAGKRFPTTDDLSIPAIPLTGQPLTHGIVQLTAYFATSAEIGQEHIHGFKINTRPLIADADYDAYHQQALAIAKILDSIN